MLLTPLFFSCRPILSMFTELILPGTLIFQGILTNSHVKAEEKKRNEIYHSLVWKGESQTSWQCCNPFWCFLLPLKYYYMWPNGQKAKGKIRSWLRVISHFMQARPGQTLISPQLVSHNSLYVGLLLCLVWKLQVVQNAVGGVHSWIPRFTHIHQGWKCCTACLLPTELSSSFCC